MFKQGIGWKIDRLGALIKTDKSISMIANEWSQLATGNDADLEIPLNPDDPSKPMIIFTILDNKKYVIGYFEEKNSINIHLDYDDADISEYTEMNHEMNEFYDSVERLLTKYLPESVTDIKLGVEMIDYIDKPSDGIEKFKHNFSYFSGINAGISEIDLKLKSKFFIENNVEIRKTLEFSNQKKLKIVVDSNMENASTKNIITANIELDIVKEDVANIDAINHIGILKKSLLDIVREELCYESNIKK
ncbi:MULTISPECIES: hypothetical protein [unclassified Psychrobacter]|uniref:hypothetical protein n=3 Tax=Psychrobacter TaxID=497 RepID=UPI003FD4DB50